MASPNRGEVWLVDLGVVAKIRLCLVLSIRALDHDRGLATLLPAQLLRSVPGLRLRLPLHF